MESKQQSSSNKKKTNIGAPKNFLIPILLLHLREWNSHGYELMEKLTKFGINSLDHGNFYRLLRQLEKDSLVTSVWDTTSGGPAKRIYSITESGEQYLDMWANSLSEYQKMLNQFFNLYNPFYSPMRSTTSSSSNKEVEVKKEDETEAKEQASSIEEVETPKAEVAATTAKKTTTTTRSTPKTATKRTAKPRATRTSRTSTSKATSSTTKVTATAAKETANVSAQTKEQK